MCDRCVTDVEDWLHLRSHHCCYHDSSSTQAQTKVSAEPNLNDFQIFMSNLLQLLVRLSCIYSGSLSEIKIPFTRSEYVPQTLNYD